MWLVSLPKIVHICTCTEGERLGPSLAGHKCNKSVIIQTGDRNYGSSVKLGYCLCVGRAAI